MTESKAIERVAAETGLEPKDVERVLQAAGKTFLEARWRHGLMAGQRIGTSRPGLGLETLGEGEQGLVPLILATAAALRARRDHHEQLIEALTPEHHEIPTPGAVMQARRSVEARNALLAEFGALRSSEIAELAGSRAANLAALANRWRSENRLVAVLVGHELLCPGFQFTSEGKPHPAVGEALAALRSNSGVSDWQAALWFVGQTAGSAAGARSTCST